MIYVSVYMYVCVNIYIYIYNIYVCYRSSPLTSILHFNSSNSILLINQRAQQPDASAGQGGFRFGRGGVGGAGAFSWAPNLARSQDLKKPSNSLQAAIQDNPKAEWREKLRKFKEGEERKARDAAYETSRCSETPCALYVCMYVYMHVYIYIYMLHVIYI